MVMADVMKVIFYPRSSKVNGKKTVPLYMRVTIDGRRFQCATGRTTKPEEWSRDPEGVIGKSREAKLTNDVLTTFKAKAYEIQKQLIQSDLPMNIDEFVTLWKGGASKQKSIMLCEVFEEHNSQVHQLVGADYSPSTAKRYRTSLRHTRNFLMQKYKVQDVPIRKLDYKFITDYEFWLKVTRKCNHNSAIKYLTNFRKIVHICVKNGWLERDPFVGFKMAKKEVDRPFLNKEELNALASKSFEMDRLSQVRDIFLFCCFTGLAYADIQKLRPDEIVKGHDGAMWVFTKREKTETPSRIPLLPQALEIVERYKKLPECVIKKKVLPVPTNQKMNAYLKEIADVCGIKKYLTTHLARHTFATTVTLTNGVPIESVSKMLGHRNLRTTQHYAKILDLKVGEDMKALREKFAKM
jgi:site-specific recombinase XerD